MFMLHVGETPCELSQQDYRKLAANTEGYVIYVPTPLSVHISVRYSGSDIAVVVRDALMQPVRKVMSATHFKQVDHEGKTKWTPCSPGDPAAEEMTWSNIESDELLEPALKIKDFLKSLETVRPTVTADDIRKHDQWTQESGT